MIKLVVHGPGIQKDVTGSIFRQKHKVDKNKMLDKIDETYSILFNKLNEKRNE